MECGGPTPLCRRLGGKQRRARTPAVHEFIAKNEVFRDELTEAGRDGPRYTKSLARKAKAGADARGTRVHREE
jgi:hypothetical protein